MTNVELTEALIPLSLRDIPAQGTPYGRLFKGDITNGNMLHCTTLRTFF